MKNTARFRTFGLLGMVVCANAWAGSPVSWETLERVGSGSRDLSMKADATGALHVAFTGCVETNCSKNALRYGRMTPAGVWTFETVDTANNDTGWFPALTVDGGGTVRIFYANHKAIKMRVATRNPANGKWKLADGASGQGGWWNAAQTGPQGTWSASTQFPDRSWSTPGLGVGRWDATAKRGNFEIIDQGGNVGWFPSVALDGEGLPLVTYTSGGYPSGDLRLRRKLASGAWAKDWIDAKATKSAVAVGANGDVWVAFQHVFDDEGKNGNMMLGRSSELGVWDIQLVDGDPAGTASTGYHPQLTLSPEGKPVLFYREAAKDNCLMMAKLDEAGAWASRCASARGTGGYYPELAWDAQGRLHVLYEDEISLQHGVCESCR